MSANKLAIVEDSLHFSILLNESPKEIYTAINNVRCWWDGDIQGDTDKLNAEFIYQYQDFHRTVKKIVELVPDKKIVWLITESGINFVKDKNEWLGTKIIFEIKSKGQQTELTFTHEGLVPGIECFEKCEGAWGYYIKESLYQFITTGKKPNKKD